MSKPDMTGRNWQARIPADLMSIKKAIRIERDRLFELELSTGKEPEDCETFHLEWLEQERARGVQQIVTNFQEGKMTTKEKIKDWVIGLAGMFSFWLFLMYMVTEAL